MTAKEFFDKHIEKAVDIDSAAGVQCVDLFKAFTKENYGVWQYNCTNNAASGLWIYRKDKPYYQYFVDANINDLHNGDWVIWGNCKQCPNTHVAMYYNGKFLGQNQEGIKAATWINLSTNGVIGVLRPKMYIQTHNIGYKAHVQDIGWQGWKYDGEVAGTTGQTKRMEALRIDYDKPVYAKAHISDIGWKDYGKINLNTIIGTEGQSRRLEALCLKGDFQYRVHIQDFGWTNWTQADGIITLGSVGMSKSIEAIQIK